jgi:uncharacterized membrane protein
LGKKKKRKKRSQKKPPLGKPEARKKKKDQPVLRKRENPNWPLTVLAIAGMVLTGYLVLISWLDQTPLYCDDGSPCDIVQQSRWGTFLLLPTAFWGFLTYAILAYIGLRVRKAGLHWKAAWIVSLVGLGYSVYLNTISLLVIEATCAYCIASLLIMAVIFGLVMFQRPERLPHFKFATWVIETMVIVIVFVGVMHLHYSGVFDPAAGPEDPYLKGLAEHLTEEKAVVYGAFW